MKKVITAVLVLGILVGQFGFISPIFGTPTEQAADGLPFEH